MQERNKNPRKFTGVDSSTWKVVTFSGKAIVGTKHDGSRVVLKGYNGYRSANIIARQAGGVAVRE